MDTNKIIHNLKKDLVNKAGIGRAGFENLEQRHKHIYIYMRLIGYMIVEGNLRTHKTRFGVQPNNFQGRIKEIQWQKIIK